MKICLLADTHGLHRKIKMPKCDLILHAGDITMQGELSIITDFNEWLGELKVPAIVIAGNHDLTLENNRHVGKAMLNNAVYLEDKPVKFKNLKIYGSPMSPKIAHWAFGYEREHADLVWNDVPEDIDILITHGPPYKILDKCIYGHRQVGCPALLKRIQEIKPKYHIFGHIHESRGTKKTKETKFINASICNFPDYGDIRRPITIEV